MGAIVGRALVVWALSGATACNPFEGFAECDSRNITLDSVNVDANAASDGLLGDYTGALTWTRTGMATSLLVSVARSDARKIVAESDCDGKLDGFTVPLRISATSDDGLVAIEREHDVTLDESGAFKAISPPAIEGAVSFSALKAEGITPAEWVSNFSPSLSLPLSVPDLIPQNGTVAAEVGPFDNRMTVVLGEIEFP
jgi:hypothetical protein